MIHIRASMNAKDFASEREYHRALQSCNEAAGLAWHRDMLPDHFKKGTQAKYGNQPRKPKYRAWKRKKYESRRPMRNGQYVEGSGETDNVLSGDMRDLLTSASIVRAFKTRATVTMTGPRYVTMKAFDGNVGKAISEGWTYGKNKRKFRQSSIGVQPDKTAEVTATTEEERQKLANIQDKILERAASGWHGV